MNRNVLLGWVSRATALGLSLVNTRLLVDLVGLQGLGAQAIVGSIAPWILLLNLGLPPSTQNLISEWRAEGKPLERLKGTAGQMALVLFVGFAPLSAVVGLGVQHFLLVHYPGVAGWSVVTACLLLLVNALGALLTSMLYADHRGLWPNLSAGASSLLLCALLGGLLKAKVDDLNVVLAAYFAPSALSTLVSAWLLKLNLRQAWDSACARALVRRARGFLLVSFLGTATLGIDYIVLSHVLDDAELAAYNLSGRLFLVIPVIHGVVLAAAWTPMCDLFARQHYAEGRRYVWRVVRVGLMVALGTGGTTLVLFPRLLPLLSGHAVAIVPMSTLLLWWAYVSIRAWSDTFYTALQSLGRTSALNKYLFVQAPVSVALQALLGPVYGAQGVLAGLIASFMLTCAWYLPMTTYRSTAAVPVRR